MVHVLELIPPVGQFLAAHILGYAGIRRRDMPLNSHVLQSRMAAPPCQTNRVSVHIPSYCLKHIQTHTCSPSTRRRVTLLPLQYRPHMTLLNKGSCAPVVLFFACCIICDLQLQLMLCDAVPTNNTVCVLHTHRNTKLKFAGWSQN